MALFENFPYTNFHELNLDWLLQKMKELAAEQKTLEEAMDELEYTIHHLDVDQAVVETLNNMLADGTLGDLMAEAIAEYESQIGNIIAQQNQEIGVIKARVDEITNLPEGSTAGDAELADIRIDAWGDTWNTAGNAVRGQIGALADNNPTNLVWPTVPGTSTNNGLTWTFNGDGSLTITGTATATTTIYLNGQTSASMANLPLGNYVVQRWIVSGSGNVRFSRLANGSGVNLIATYDSYASATFTQTASDGGVYLQVGNAQTVNGTFRFMVSEDLGLAYPKYSPMVEHTAKDAVARTAVADLAADMDGGVKWRYIASPGVQAASEGIEVLMDNKWLILLVHSVDNAQYMDVWRIAYCWQSDSNFTRIAQLTTSGEWECALKLSTWSDFVGGYIHGHEFMTNVSNNFNPTLFNDGVPILPTELSTYTGQQYCKELTFYVHTSLNSPADTTQTRARHTKVYHFTSDGLVLDQAVNWNTSGTTAACYMAMLPMAKNRTYAWYDDSASSAGWRRFYDWTDPQQSFPDNFSYSHMFAKNSSIGGAGWGTIEFNIERYPELLTGGDTFLVTDNGTGHSYAKCYYVVCDGESVAVGTSWNSRTVYKYHPPTA